MVTAFGVVGAGYGDEGKGRNVDAIVRRIGPGGTVVVRSNGGAQAGHTVVTPDGHRHVFHHVGSGAYAGAATHLSRYFVHHPMTFMAEREVLAAQGACVDISADPRGYVTTPWDMMVNQVVETARGGSRHGSCGYGFGETVGRNEETPFGLTVADLERPDLEERLSSIRDVWLPARLEALGAKPDEDTTAAIASPDIMSRFLWDCMMFRESVSVMSDAALGMAGNVVFEAAQGLLLDQCARGFPHVTRSNTGVRNMAEIAREAGITAIDVTYATRCYLTRHGAGPMPDERDMSPWFDIVDETNVPNAWQDSIRYGMLSLGILSASIREDLGKGGGIHLTPRIAVSCLDQARGAVPLIWNGGTEMVDPACVAGIMTSSTGMATTGWWSADNGAAALAA